MRGGHSRQGSKGEPPTSFSRDCGEAAGAQDSSDQRTKRKRSGKARPRNGETVSETGSYVYQAGPIHQGAEEDFEPSFSCFQLPHAEVILRY